MDRVIRSNIPLARHMGRPLQVGLRTILLMRRGGITLPKVRSFNSIQGVIGLIIPQLCLLIRRWSRPSRRSRANDPCWPPLATQVIASTRRYAICVADRLVLQNKTAFPDSDQCSELVLQGWHMVAAINDESCNLSFSVENYRHNAFVRNHTRL